MTVSENKKVSLSIIVTAWNGSSHLRECLSSLENQIEDASGAEVITVSNFEGGISEIKAEFPFVKYFILSQETTVPQLRTYGVLRAGGAVIAVTEDFCTPDSAWCREIEKAHKLPHAAIGGAVKNKHDAGALDWAVFFYDYGKYLPPLRAGVTETLSGLNVSYKKEILEQLRENYEDGFFETFIHEELKVRGHDLYLMPSAIVRHNKSYQLKKTVFQFFHQARSFAARRVNNLPPSRRLLFITASVILPILLPARVVWRTMNKGRHLKELLRSLPFLMILTSVWAFGEFCGYLNGEGKSGGEWK